MLKYLLWRCCVFKPHRFNPLLKALPNADHAKKVASKLVHGQTHEELLQQTTQTTTVAQGQTQTTTRVVTADVKTTETPAEHGKAHKKTEVDVTAEVIRTTKPASQKN